MLWPPEGSLALAGTSVEPARAPELSPAPARINPLVRLRAHSVNGSARKTASAMRSISWKPGNCLNPRQ